VSDSRPLWSLKLVPISTFWFGSQRARYASQVEYPSSILVARSTVLVRELNVQEATRFAFHPSAKEQKMGETNDSAGKFEEAHAATAPVDGYVGDLAVQAKWDDRYADREKMWSGQPNGALVAEVAGLSPARVLAVGSGAGAGAGGRACPRRRCSHSLGARWTRGGATRARVVRIRLCAVPGPTSNARRRRRARVPRRRR
jgi:hypothetical protein